MLIVTISVWLIVITMKKLSIVIPTKNRHGYLSGLVESFSKHRSDEVECVVYDNSDEECGAFVTLVSRLKDSRVVYKYDPEPISVVENFDRALKVACGEYVCMLGDDDGVLLDVALQVVSFASVHNLDAVVVNKAQYYWPDTRHATWGGLLSGRVFFNKYSWLVRMLDPTSELGRVLKEPASNSLYGLPRVYHGFVSKASLDGLRKRIGTCFPGPSPDMANAVALAALVSRVGYADVPAVISGHGRKSAAGLGGVGQHHGRIEKQASLPGDTADRWGECIPRFWSGGTIYAESARRALAELGLSEAWRLNYAQVWAFCLVFEGNYRGEIFSLLKRRPDKWLLVACYVSKLTVFRAANLFVNFIRYVVLRGPSAKAPSMSAAQLVLLGRLGRARRKKVLRLK